MKRILVGLGCLLIPIVIILLVRTLNMSSRQVAAEPITVKPADAERAALGLSNAIQHVTISYHDYSRFDPAVFLALHAQLEQDFPRVHQELRREVVAEMSLLYTWPGSQPDLAPILLLAHLDVVPVEAGTEADWSHPAFSGKIVDGFVWGRGSMDYKNGVVGTLEAVETLLERGFQPKRTVYMAFGHDEEVGGQEGAKNLAKLLTERGIKADMILDEGAVVIGGTLSGLGKPLALLGIAEKGYMTVELTTKLQGGHSSMPPPQTAVGVLAAAIHQLEQNPFQAKVKGATNQMFDFLGPEHGFGLRLLFANRWLLGSVLIGQLEGKASTNAGIRTTMAATMFEAGTKENVLPQTARAVVNLRLLPGETPASALAYISRVISDPRVTVKITGNPTQASAVTDIQSDQFKLLHRTVMQSFPDALVAPYLVVGGTDCKHYGQVSDYILRFHPLRLMNEDLARVHGTNERVSVKDFGDAVTFYMQLVSNRAG